MPATPAVPPIYSAEARDASVNPLAADLETKYHLQLQFLDKLLDDVVSVDRPDGVMEGPDGSVIPVDVEEAIMVCLTPCPIQRLVPLDDDIGPGTLAQLRSIGQMFVDTANRLDAALADGSFPSDHVKSFRVVDDQGETTFESPAFGEAITFARARNGEPGQNCRVEPVFL